MASALKSALPSHLKPSGLGGDGEKEFARKHHGKTQSHMVSSADLFIVTKHEGSDCYDGTKKARYLSVLEAKASRML